MMRTSINLIAFFTVFLFTLVSTSAEAIPAFARKYDTKCSSCHTAYPQLNKAGRKFKEAGYAFPKVKGEETISDFLTWDKYVPLSIVVKTRPYDKKSPGEKKLRAIHEVEILAGGHFSKNVSGFVELEAEDEALNEFGFEIGVAHSWLTVHHSKSLNAQIAWGPLLSADPYDTYSGGRKLTRSTQSVIDQSFGGADDGGKLGSPRQSVSVYGRPIPKLFYNVGVGGLAGDPEGENFSTYFARVAFDVNKDVMVGGLLVSGTKEAVAAGSDGTILVLCTGSGVPVAGCAATGDIVSVTDVGSGSPAEDERNFQRIGLDIQVDIDDIRVMGAFISAEDDDTTGGGNTKNNAFYLHGQYTVKEKGRPLMVGLIRLDEFEKENGTKSFSSATFNLTYYFSQNMKGFVEYFDQYDGPTPADEKSRITFQAEVAF